jgi:GT2 family glycosyltransferase
LIELNNCIGFVVIGRNEGERLKRCFDCILEPGRRIVYVDSGSTDDSVNLAESLHIDIVNLDMSIPFSAARARNEGFYYLLHKYPDLEFVQFIDGDCELASGWIEAAIAFFSERPQCAIVAGRRQEKYPHRSIYNLLCDIEWDTPIGIAYSCGGDFMIRRSAFVEVNGFDPNVIAGEEPELCYRLRRIGWEIYRIDQAMTLHDAAIYRFSQWWRRSIRTGHAYAQGFFLHYRDRQGYCLKASLKAFFWALLFPLSVILISLLHGVGYLFLLFFYFIQFVRIFLEKSKQLNDLPSAVWYALFTVLSKWPQLIGQILFIKRRLSGAKLVIIEYS